MSLESMLSFQQSKQDIVSTGNVCKILRILLFMKELSRNIKLNLEKIIPYWTKNLVTDKQYIIAHSEFAVRATGDIYFFCVADIIVVFLRDVEVIY